MSKEVEQIKEIEQAKSKKSFWNLLKSFLWGLFKVFYISLWTVAILFIIWYFGSNYYYGSWYYNAQQDTKKAVIYDLINASQTCKVITIWSKKDKTLTKLINVACLKQQTPNKNDTQVANPQTSQK